MAVGLLKDDTTLRAHIFKVRLSLPGSGMQKIKNPGLYVPEAQGSRKYEGDLCYKPSI